MELELQIKMNPKLYVRDPDSTELGRNIIKHSIELIYELGFEEFTFKKLAHQIGTTEAGIYRYFENKHRLLTYVITWFWTWMEYQVIFFTNNIKLPDEKIRTIVTLLSLGAEDKYMLGHIDKNKLHSIVIAEGNKAYFTKHVNEDNQARLFKPYKDLCNRIAELFLEYNPHFKYPHSLASTLIETAYHQLYFKDHLPSLTDFSKEKGNTTLFAFLNHLVFSSLNLK